MHQRHLTVASIYFGCFLQTALCLIIAGCSKNHDDSTTETEVPTTVQATFINPNVRKASIAREEAAITIQKALRKHHAVQI